MTQHTSVSDEPSILVVDDDKIFRERLVRALHGRGLTVYVAEDAETALEAAKDFEPERAVLDLRMPGRSGLDLVADLHAIEPTMQIVVLTGYGSIATAVEAVKRGAIDYLTKPADTDQILAAFDRNGAATGETSEHTPSLARVEWEHIQRTLADTGGNISETARRLGIHRRSLQRKLGKLPPFE